MSKLNWNFKVNFVGEDNILIAMKRKDDKVWTEMLLGIREYTEFMQLLQEFNINFKERIDQKLVESYFND